MIHNDNEINNIEKDYLDTISVIKNNQEEMLALLPLYQFETNVLQDKYISYAQHNIDNAIFLSSQINFFKFLPLLPPRLNQPFFSFQQPTLCDLNERINCLYYRKMNPNIEDKTIDEILQNFFHVPWITEYFVTFSFPNLFEQFYGKEQQKAAVTFIQNHIHDPLAPRLLITFLFHAYIFRERFCSSLFSYYLSKINEQNLDDIKTCKSYEDFDIDPIDALKSCFEECSYYLTEYHFDGINLFEGSKKLNVLKQFWDDFLIHCSYSSYFSSDPLLTFLFKCRDSFKTLDLNSAAIFYTKPFMTFSIPKSANIVFHSGAKIAMTLLDLEIMKVLPEFQFQRDKSFKCPPDLEQLAFAFCPRALHLFKNVEQMPTIKDAKNKLDCLKIKKKAVEFVSKPATKLAYIKNLHTNIQKDLYIQFSVYCSSQPVELFSMENQRYYYALSIFMRFFDKVIPSYLKTRGDNRLEARNELIQEVSIKIREKVHETIEEDTSVILDYLGKLANQYQTDQSIRFIPYNKQQQSFFRIHDSISMTLEFCYEVSSKSNILQSKIQLLNSQYDQTTSQPPPIENNHNHELLKNSLQSIIEWGLILRKAIIFDGTLFNVIDFISFFGTLDSDLHGIGDPNLAKQIIFAELLEGKDGFILQHILKETNIIFASMTQSNNLIIKMKNNLENIMTYIDQS